MYNRILRLLSLSLLILSGATYSYTQDLGASVSMLGNGIKEEAFKRSFNKADWLEQAEGLKISNVPEASAHMSKLVQGIKPRSFYPGLSPFRKELIEKFNGIEDTQEFVEHLSMLANSVDGNLLTQEFKRAKGDWLDVLIDYVY